MPVARSKILPEIAAADAISAAVQLWVPAFASLKPWVFDQGPTFRCLVGQTFNATLDATWPWRALSDLQIKAAEEALRLAAAHADSGRKTLSDLMETLWPAQAGAGHQTEPTNA